MPWRVNSHGESGWRLASRISSRVMVREGYVEYSDILGHLRYHFISITSFIV
jgi:hypothetical protein